MSHMSNIHAESAADRADALEHEVTCLRSVMRLAADECTILVGMIAAGGCHWSDVVGHLSVCITSLREAVADPIPWGFADTGEDVEF